TAAAIIEKRLAGPPPPLRTLRPAVPEALEAAVHRTLAPNPADRPRTAGEVADALRDALTADSRTTRQHPRAHPKANRWRPGLAPLTTLTVGAVALAVALLVRNRDPAARPRRAASARLVAVLPFDVRSSDSSLAFLRDGMPDLLAAALAGVPELIVADQHE